MTDVESTGFPAGTRPCARAASRIAAALAALAPLLLVAGLAALASPPSAAETPPPAKPGEDPIANWYDDPFFVVRNRIPDCPEPLGPRTAESLRKTQTHNRSERGTRCWQEGRCRLPNSFMYDPEIAAAVRKTFEASRAWSDASLWVTVQRRIVWVEGCVAQSYRYGALEKVLRKVPDVELVVVNVRRGPKGEIPYRVMPAR